MNPSPLRYPGGKYKLYPYVEQLIQINNCSTYIEPFCGGAAIAIQLLISNKVENVIINDYDYSIYCFWDSVINNTELFVKKIEETNINVDEWMIQKKIHDEYQDCSYSSLDIGFSTFFLNRTNRSGIISKAGPIGGYTQDGHYKIDCRFNKEKLIEQIEIIGALSKRIKVFSYEALDFVDNVILKTRNSLVFFDPPYYKKGPVLYQNFYSHGDHNNLAYVITHSLKNRKWIVTYDNVDSIKSMYPNISRIEFALNYSLQKKRKGTEVLFFSKKVVRPFNEDRYLCLI